MRGIFQNTKWVARLPLCLAIIVCAAGGSAFAQGAFPGQPLNDTFANRTVIPSSWTAATNWISGSLSNATSEAGEPFIDGVSSGQTVWGTWTAPANGIITLSVKAETFSPLLTVYAGSAPISAPGALGAFPGSAITASVFTNLSLVASNNYLACYEHSGCGCHWRERNQITFHVARGQAYQICVDSAIITDASWVQDQQLQFHYWIVQQTTNVLAGGNVQLGLQFTPAPKNDDFVNRLKLSGPRTSTTASNAGGSKELGEPNHAGNPGGSSVWYSWTAPASGQVTLSTNEVPVYSPPSSTDGGSYGAGVITFNPGPARPYQPTCGNLIDQNPPPVFYPVLAAYTGTAVNSLTPANCLPVLLPAFPNAVEFDVVKGQTYQIAYDGNLGTTGEIPLYLALTTPAANSTFRNRLPLHGVSVAATSYNAGALHQAGEPILSGSLGKTVWWSWTAPVGGTVSIDLSGSDYSFPTAVFTGMTPASLQMIAQGSGGVSFQAIQGKTYQIAVSDHNGLTGAIKLNLQAPIVDLPLYRLTNDRNGANLSYLAAPNVVVALLYSADNVNWKIIQTKPVLGKMVLFQTRPIPTSSGPFYRAIIFDLR